MVASEFAIVGKVSRKEFQYVTCSDIATAVVQFEKFAEQIGFKVDWETSELFINDEGFAMLLHNDVVIFLIAIDPEIALKTLLIDDTE